MTEIGIEAARAQLGDLAGAAQRGQTIYLTRRGRRIARIAPLTEPTPPGGVMQLINATPHPVTIGGLNIPPSGILPRVAELADPDGTVTVDGVEVQIERVTYGEVTNLPDESDGVMYVVSRMVAEALPHRKDLVFPTRQVRDANGRIVGCAALGRAN